jgi:hypothetical protein
MDKLYLLEVFVLGIFFNNCSCLQLLSILNTFLAHVALELYCDGLHESNHGPIVGGSKI